MAREKKIQFQLACYNWLVDNQVQFPHSVFRILLLIIRQTIAFQKERDFLRYSLIAKKTGLSKTTIYSSTNFLLKEKLIERYDKNNNLLKSIPRGYRGEIYYTASEELYQKLIQYYNKKWVSTGSKNTPVTVSKSEPYKYKDIQKEIITNNNNNLQIGGYKKRYIKEFRSDNPPLPGEYDD